MLHAEAVARSVHVEALLSDIHLPRTRQVTGPVVVKEDGELVRRNLAVEPRRVVARQLDRVVTGRQLHRADLVVLEHREDARAGQATQRGSRRQIAYRRSLKINRRERAKLREALAIE